MNPPAAAQTVNAQILEAMDAQTSAFKADVLKGLASPQKALPSRWLYDDRGSELFEEITKLPEYYPTRTETAILSEHAESLATFCGQGSVIIEYGAGASVKSQILLRALQQPRMYVPIDIAGDFLAVSAAHLRKRFPTLEILPIAADFTTDFDLPATIPADAARTAFFPGSTIGNLTVKDAAAFLARINKHISEAEVDSLQQEGPRQEGARQEWHPGRAIIGIDLIKDIDILLKAYDDAAGITAAFNLNILARINRELAGTFKLDHFHHYARWNEAESAIEMHLVANVSHEAVVAGRTFSFTAGETIHTETSRKYTRESFASIAHQAGWKVAKIWSDDRGWYAVVGLETTL